EASIVGSLRPRAVWSLLVCRYARSNAVDAECRTRPRESTKGAETNERRCFQVLAPVRMERADLPDRIHLLLGCIGIEHTPRVAEYDASRAGGALSSQRQQPASRLRQQYDDRGLLHDLEFRDLHRHAAHGSR